MTRAKPDNDAFVDEMIDRLHPLVVRADTKFAIIEILGSFEHYGYPQAAIGSDARDVFPFLYGLSEGEIHKLPFVLTPNDCTAHVEIWSGQSEFRIALTDATQEHEQRRELQQKSNELRLLNEQLERVNSELDLQRSEAQRLSALQQQFIASMSHEFRTPLSSILNYSKYVRDQQSGQTADLDVGVDGIERSASYLLNLVDNLIGYAQFELDGISINREPTNIRQLVADIDLLFAKETEQKGLAWSISRAENVPQSLVIDETRVRQVLINVLSNAVKYTISGSVSLALDWEVESLSIRVSDTGSGISDDDQQIIFDAFERGHASDISGSGLGLHITRKLIAAMHGNMTLKSTLNEGTQVNIEIPAVAVGEEKHQRILNERKILIVEDDTDVYDILEIYLDDIGYDVYHADCANTALEVYPAILPHIVIADLHLPDMRGDVLIENLRSADFSGIAVMLTASTLVADKNRALSAGFDTVMIKPVTPEKLIATLSALSGSLIE